MLLQASDVSDVQPLQSNAGNLALPVQVNVVSAEQSVRFTFVSASRLSIVAVVKFVRFDALILSIALQFSIDSVVSATQLLTLSDVRASLVSQESDVSEVQLLKSNVGNLALFVQVNVESAEQPVRFTFVSASRLLIVADVKFFRFDTLMLCIALQFLIDSVVSATQPLALRIVRASLVSQESDVSEVQPLKLRFVSASRL